MAKKKKWYASKTIILAALQAVAGLLIAFGTDYPEVGGIAMAKSAVDLVLRFVSTTEVGS